MTDLVDGGSGCLVSGQSISPDRRSLTFTAIFRVEPGDIVGGTAAQAVWVVGVDGQGFRRLTPPLRNTDTGEACTSNADCQAPTFCGPAQVCRLGISVSDVDDPVWTVDASQVLFNIGKFTTVNGDLTGGTYPWIVSAAGGFPTPTLAVQGCTIVSAVSPDPMGTGFVANHQVCLPGTEPGLYLHAFAGGDPTKLVTKTTSSVDPVQEPPWWLEDGSGFVFAGTGMLPVGGQVTYATGGYAFDMTTKSVSPIIAPPTTDAIVSSIAIARDGKFLAYCLTSGGASDIVVVDLRPKPATTFMATTDGKSCFPSF